MEVSKTVSLHPTSVMVCVWEVAAGVCQVFCQMFCSCGGANFVSIIISNGDTALVSSDHVVLSTVSTDRLERFTLVPLVYKGFGFTSFSRERCYG